MQNTVFQIRSEQQQLLSLIRQAPQGSSLMAQLMHSLGEVSARLALYEASISEMQP